MGGDRLFDVKGFKPYALRYGLCGVPALLTVFGSGAAQILTILGISLIVSGMIQWVLAHTENEYFLSTTWNANHVKLSSNSKAKNGREREKQISQRRGEALDRAKREGKLIAWCFAGIGAILIVISLIIQYA